MCLVLWRLRDLFCLICHQFFPIANKNSTHRNVRMTSIIMILDWRAINPESWLKLLQKRRNRQRSRSTRNSLVTISFARWHVTRRAKDWIEVSLSESHKICFNMLNEVCILIRKWCSAYWPMRIWIKYSGSGQIDWNHTHVQIQTIDHKHWFGGHFAWSYFVWDVLGFWKFDQSVWTAWTAANRHNTSTACEHRSFPWNGQQFANVQHIFDRRIPFTLHGNRYLVGDGQPTWLNQISLLSTVRTAHFFFLQKSFQNSERRLNRINLLFRCVLFISQTVSRVMWVGAIAHTFYGVRLVAQRFESIFIGP